MLNLKRLNKSSITTQPERVRQMFGSIARRYDLANHVLSCGADFYWRSHAAQIIARWTPENIVDLATGTGDLAVAIRKKSPNAEIVAVDVLAEMLELAKKKGVQRTIMADAMRLPLADSSFDCVTVAFGLRNMENWSGALREMARVLTANGHLLILEFSLPQSSIFRAVYRFYLHQCLPFLGSFITRQKNAYDYLGQSIEEFPSGAAMLRLIEANGFRNANAEPLSRGIVTIYTAEKRQASG
ncbi:MAG: bifunctional demethylmenaquinone methyltransferase/2-methoxy-6-polyprenyl-1,4-benzoquinol methylase UbiE [Verrucomicrobia bacterium]|nr:MAG: bifunctional demethylmenaquinone methyltransferase/2-methoxy-6-polyprenyl-1,4-benzoquinol methylase UbiE [Verrucomicrobiota bacterium]